jgi:iron(III) transport system permease protein
MEINWLRGKLRHELPGGKWLISTLAITLVILVPLFIVVLEFFQPSTDIWQHFVSSLIPGYLKNSILLLAGAGICTFILGTGTAWLVSMYSFPGRKFLAWALVMPITIPAWILGYTWAGMLDYTSPLYTFLRNRYEVETGAYLFFDLLSLKGAIVIFSLALYPYVYLICRAFFMNQSAAMLETAASMGRSPVESFFRVALPMARPAIVAGVTLVLMEVLNDYGLVRYFGVETFTTGIFSAWFAFGDRSTALRLAGWLVVIVLAIIMAEKFQRGRARFDILGGSYRPLRRREPGKAMAVLATAFCMVPFLLGFLLPFATLLIWTFKTASVVADLSFFRLAANSFLLAASAAATGMAVALIILFSLRVSRSKFVYLLSKTATMGYAIPGAVVAIGILIPLLIADNWLRHAQALFTGSSAGFMLSSSVFALVYAYLVRFLAIGYNSLEAGYERISLSIDESAASLGSSKGRTLRELHLPLLKGTLLGGGLLIFVDVLKELPLTLILRPFNFDTLAIRAFEYASDERVAQSAPAALVVILTAMVPAFMMNRILTGKKKLRLISPVPGQIKEMKSAPEKKPVATTDSNKPGLL